MIENLKICNVGSYCDDGININPKKINFFYGENGSGKTTISRVIKDKTNFQNCSITWQGNRELETLVYNQDFIKNNFQQTNSLNGIFTLGENNINVQNDIEELENKINENKELISYKRRSISEISSEKKTYKKLIRIIFGKSYIKKIRTLLIKLLMVTKVVKITL